MNTGIKKEPAFDVKQAIRKIASRLEARADDSEGQDKMMPVGASSSVAQTVEQKYGSQPIPVSIGKKPLKQWAKNLEKGDYVILGDENEDGLVMPRKEFLARYGKGQSELHNPVWDSDYGRS